MLKYFSLTLFALLLFFVVACDEGGGSGVGDEGQPRSNPPIEYADAFDAAAYEDEIRDEIFRSAYQEGFREGQTDGYDDGYQDGYDEGWFDGCVWLGETLLANGAQIWYQC